MQGGLNSAHRRSRFDRTLLDSGCVADLDVEPRPGVHFGEDHGRDLLFAGDRRHRWQQLSPRPESLAGLGKGSLSAADVLAAMHVG